VAAANLATRLEAARDRGLANLAAIAAAESFRHGLTTSQCLGYLRDNLHYRLGDSEREALELFRRHADRLGLLGDLRSPAPAVTS
jgi:predicted solute-binding protein